LRSFREIGIKVWMLTGDNPFTAVNIAHSCGLIEKNQKTYIVSQSSRKQIKQELDKIKKQIEKNKKLSKFNNNIPINYEDNVNKGIMSNSGYNQEKNELCLVITGDALTIIQKDGIIINNNEITNNSYNKKIMKGNGIKPRKDIYKMEKNLEEIFDKENNNMKRIIKEKKDKFTFIAEEEEKNNQANRSDDHEDVCHNNESKSINTNDNNEIKIRSQIKKTVKEDNKNNKNNNNQNEINKKEKKKEYDNEGVEEGKLLNLFLEIIRATNTVICSRVSPKQKADLILLVKKFEKEKMTTLAIGDGANDVNMITAADVGIGIMGNEGQQAARASDYVIGQFSFLKRLLFVHGREAQRKNAFAISYILWKNFLYVIPMIM